MERYKKGDLVGIKFKCNEENQKLENGIIVEVLRRNNQEPLWDSYLVLFKGMVDAFPARRLVNQFKKSVLQ